jgi:hypothetical protein
MALTSPTTSYPTSPTGTAAATSTTVANTGVESTAGLLENLGGQSEHGPVLTSAGSVA